MVHTALPPLDEPHATALSDIAAFEENGHCCVRGLASADECRAYLPEIQAGVDRWHPEPQPMETRTTYGKAFLQAGALRKIHAPVRGFTDSSRFAAVAAALLGVDAVRLYHDQALFKEAGGGRTPWHQDQNYWPLDTDHTITMWMPLRDLDPAVGSMMFVDGSHRFGDIGAGEISDTSDAAIQTRVDSGEYSTTTHGSLAAGDATFHRGWTVHCAGPNPTDRMRPVMTVIWFADGTRIAEPTSPEQKFDLRVWLADGTPGSQAAGPDNPILWPTD